MPWKKVDATQQRKEFVERCLEQETPVWDLCAEYGVSRKTAYKWIQRFRAGGGAALADRSHAPHACPRAMPAQVTGAILDARIQHPKWGPRKLLAWLGRRKPELALPAASTAGELLRRHRLVLPRKTRRRVPVCEPFAGCTGPNSLMCLDFKGWFLVGDGRRCNPLTVSDAWSRFVFACRHLARGDEESVRKVLQAVFEEYGLPEAARSDNGPPFAANGLLGLSRLAVWLLRLGVRLERIRPGHPQQNGRHERMHLTLKVETAQPPAGTLAGQQRRFDEWRHSFNWERPHEALGMVPPGELHRRSPRPMPSRLPEPEYPADFEPRRVRGHGEVSWLSQRFFVSEALAGQTIGVGQVADALWVLRFGPLHLGVWDERRRRFSTDLPPQTQRWAEPPSVPPPPSPPALGIPAPSAPTVTDPSGPAVTHPAGPRVTDPAGQVVTHPAGPLSPIMPV